MTTTSVTRLFWFFFSFVSVLRIIYAAFFIDPMTGPDASTYFEARNDMLRHGLFAPASGIPYWPFGYPFFLALIAIPFGDSLVVVSIFQSLLWSLALISFYAVLQKAFGIRVALLSVGLLAINPALFGASVQLMYEVPQISFLLIALGLTLVKPKSRNWAIALYSFSIICIVLSISMQPKAVVITLAMYFALHSLGISRVISGVVTVFGSMLGISLVVLRNYLAGDGIGTSANFRYHITNGFHLVDPTYNFKCQFTSNYDSLSEVLCITMEKLSNPIFFLEITLNNLKNTLAPYIGNLGYGRNIGDTGTWWHAFDLRRLLPSYTWADKDSLSWLVDRTLSVTWIFLIWALIFLGVHESYKYKTKSRKFILFLVFATISSVFVLLIGQGDSRYRLGIIPFYTVFIAFALIRLFMSSFSRERN